jgi:hypothetical protein
MAALSWVSTEGVAIINYADNFLLLASSEEKLQKAVEDLTKAVGNLPGGHFHLKPYENTTLASGITFLGHQLYEASGTLRIGITETNDSHFFNELIRIDDKFHQLKLDSAGGKQKGIKLVAEFHAFSHGWLAAFRECDEIAGHIQFVQDLLDDYYEALGVTPKEVIAVIDETMGYKPKDYVLGH